MTTETPILLALKELGPSMISEIHKRTGIHKITLHQTLTKMHKNGDIKRDYMLVKRNTTSYRNGDHKYQFVWSLK